MSRTFSQSDVASHNTADSLWVIIDEDVYDLTKFQDEHPGKLPAASRFVLWNQCADVFCYHPGGKKSMLALCYLLDGFSQY